MVSGSEGSGGAEAITGSAFLTSGFGISTGFGASTGLGTSVGFGVSVVGGGAEAAGEGSNESGQLGIACAGVDASPPSSSDGGGQAGIARSVGGSGGHTSVSSGAADAPSARGGHVDFSASAATAFGASFNGAGVITAPAVESAGGSVASAWSHMSPTGTGVTEGAGGSVAGGSAEAAVEGSLSSIGSPGEVGTVCAHSGAFFGPPPLLVARGSDSVQSGSPFLAGRGAAGSSG